VSDSYIFMYLSDSVIRSMAPGTVHCVLTLVDSFAEGGHFYTQLSLGRSLKAGIREYKSGSSDTNTEHITSEVILQALVKTYFLDIEAQYPHGKDEYRESSSSSFVR